MRRMPTFIGAGASGLLLLTLAVPALAAPTASKQAEKQSMLQVIRQGIELPTLKPWQVGQQATHKLTWDAGAQGTLILDARLAVVGEEEGAYWYEWNFTNPSGSMGKEIAPIAGGLTLRFLTTQLSEDNLKQVVESLATLNTTKATSLIKKFQFQITGQPLYEVSFADLAKQTTAIVIGETTPGGTVEVPEPDGNLSWNTGKETVQVPAGTFNNSTFWQADYSGQGGAGNVRVNLHDTIPLLPLAKLVANLSGDAVGGANQVRLELISSAETGAKTQATGTPVKKTADEVVGELFLLVMTGGTSVQMQ